jgi:hypothetical protein
MVFTRKSMYNQGLREIPGHSQAILKQHLKEGVLGMFQTAPERLAISRFLPHWLMSFLPGGLAGFLASAACGSFGCASVLQNVDAQFVPIACALASSLTTSSQGVLNASLRDCIYCPSGSERAGACHG